jgi:hypothetical protein
MSRHHRQEGPVRPRRPPRHPERGRVRAAPAAPGVIERTEDVDVFAFAAGAGALSVTASPALASGSLDVRLELLDGAGAVLASDNPADRLAATVAASPAPSPPPAPTTSV